MRTPPLLLIAALCLVGVTACKDSPNPPPPGADAGSNPDAGGNGDAGGGGTDAGRDAGEVVLPDGGTVVVPVCKSTGTSCGGNAECCTGTCTNGTCGTVAGQSAVCRVTGDACDAANPCCSTNCQGGVCAPADPACRTTNDVCFKGTDCCSGVCSANGSGTAGVCQTTTGSSGCAVGGTPCTTGGGCCTRVCADTGTGVKACQRVSGCQVAGDYCSADSACCGGIPNGSVDCGNTNSRCDNGQACRAPGTICGKPLDASGNPVRLPDGGTFEVSSETNCCNGIKVGAYDRTCRLDQVGVPRCFGCPPEYVDAQGNCTPPAGACPNGLDGSPGCCLPAGNVCDFADQCCNGTACVPGSDGVRRCAAAQTCKSVGTTCSPDTSGDCCAGTACLPTSELTYACQVPSPSGGTADGGTPDAGPSCAPNGATGCATGGKVCCSSVCTNDTCEAPPQCQPQDTACSTSGDCCTGLSCSIPSGSTTGTCKAGATCSSAGQTCSPTLGCCTGLGCIAETGEPCTGTNGACACKFTIN